MSEIIQSQVSDVGVYFPHEVVERMVIEEMTPTRAWREHLNITQEEMAARLRISQSAYLRQEADLQPSEATREKIAAALGILPAQLDV